MGSPGVESEETIHRRVIVKDDGRKLYSFTFNAEPDPFAKSDGSLVQEIQPAPTAPVSEAPDSHKSVESGGHV